MTIASDGADDTLTAAWRQALNDWQRHARHSREQADIAATDALRAALAAAGPIDHAGEMMRLALERIAAGGDVTSAYIATEALEALPPRYGEAVPTSACT